MTPTVETPPRSRVVNRSDAQTHPHGQPGGRSTTDEHRIRHRLYEFYRDAAQADTPETTRLATTIETWWPAIHVALTMKVTNARTEGFNRIIKNTKRVACGFRNLENYQRRILSTIALTRARRDAA